MLFIVSEWRVVNFLHSKLSHYGTQENTHSQSHIHSHTCYFFLTLWDLLRPIYHADGSKMTISEAK